MLILLWKKLVEADVESIGTILFIKQVGLINNVERNYEGCVIYVIQKNWVLYIVR